MVESVCEFDGLLLSATGSIAASALIEPLAATKLDKATMLGFEAMALWFLCSGFWQSESDSGPGRSICNNGTRGVRMTRQCGRRATSGSG